MKWLQSPENQVKRDSDISCDSHGKKNAEKACSPLTFEQMLENLVSCLHGTGLLIPQSQCVIPSLAQFPLFHLCKHAVFAGILMILWVVTGAMGITPPRVAAMVESVLADPSRWLDYSDIWIMWFQWTHPGPSVSLMLWMALQPTPLQNQFPVLFLNTLQPLIGSSSQVPITGGPFKNLHQLGCIQWKMKISMILMALNRNMLSFRRLFRAPSLQSLHNIRWDWSWAQLLSILPFD